LTTTRQKKGVTHQAALAFAMAFALGAGVVLQSGLKARTGEEYKRLVRYHTTVHKYKVTSLQVTRPIDKTSQGHGRDEKRTKSREDALFWYVDPSCEAWLLLLDSFLFISGGRLLNPSL